MQKSCLSLIIVFFIGATSCKDSTQKTSKTNGKLFFEVLDTHLSAVTNRDLQSLRGTLSPNGPMQLILPETEIIEGVDGFMKYHEKWFSLPNWTFETKVLNTEIGSTIGVAIVEVMYREPNRDGKPYYNKMIVSYTLKKINNKWYIIKDHASSIEKSTDNT